MAFKSSCPECKETLFLFNFKKRLFSCPYCKKSIDSTKIKKSYLKPVSCQNCGKCCQFVPELSNKDIARLKKKLKDYQKYIFNKKNISYPKLHDINGKIKESHTKVRDYYCIFYDIKNTMCTIHDFKPNQCRKLEASFSCAGHKEEGEVDFSLLS